MKVLALIESADHVCFRYRLNALAWELAQQGLFLEARPLRHGMARVGDLLAARPAGIVILQRKLLPAWQLAILRRMSKFLIFDFDDAIFRRDSFAGKRQHSADRLSRFRNTICAADAVFAGNDYLAQFATAYAESQRIFVVPTCLEPNWYPAASHRRTGSAARLAWIGQSSMLPSLSAAAPQFAEIGRRLPGATLRIISNALPANIGLKTVPRPWSSATEVTELAAADIGVSWLCDDLWSLGKCGLKVLQYMAAGLPVVANPVGIHRDLVIPGETGFLAETPREWAEAVCTLAKNPEMRIRMGAAARQRIEAEYNVGRLGPRLAGLLRRLAGPSARSAQSEPNHSQIFASDACPIAEASGEYAAL